MATKYQVGWYNYFGQECVVYLKKKNYSGAVTTLTTGYPPVTIRYETPSDFMFDPINGSYMTLLLTEKVFKQLDELYTLDDREWLVEMTIDGGTWWKGYILPGHQQKAYSYTPREIEIVATDQLGYLRNVNHSYYGLYTIRTGLTMLESILSKTDLDLNMREGLNIYEDGMDQTEADSPLDQCYMDQNNYVDSEGNPKDCYTVLKDLLTKFTAVLRQVNGEWHIWRPSEAGSSYTRRLWVWRPEGGGFYYYTSNESYNPIVDTTSASKGLPLLVRVLSGGRMLTQSGYKDYKLTQDYGIQKNFIPNGDFKDWIDITHPYNWALIGGLGVLQQGEKCKIFARTVYSGLIGIVNSTGPFDNTVTQKFRLKFIFNSFVVSWETTMTFYARVVLVSTDGLLYWDFENGIWTVTLTNFEVACGEGNETKEVELFSPEIGVGLTNFYILIYIFQPVCTSVNSFVLLDTVECQLMHNPSGAGDTGETEPYDEEEEKIVTVNANSTTVGEDIIILVADLPYWAENPKQLCAGGMYLGVDRTTPTGLWEEAEGFSSAGAYSLLDWLQRKIAQQYGYSQEMLSVDIISKLILPDSVIREVNNDNKRYHINRATYDGKSGIWSMELTELKCVADIVGESGEYLMDKEESGEYILIESGGEKLRVP